MSRTRKRAIWLIHETSYDFDPNSLGTTYLWVPAMNISMLKDDLQMIETNYLTGANWATAPIAGAQRWSFGFDVPLIGQTTNAARNANTQATIQNDWLDKILTNIFGNSAGTYGCGVINTAAGELTCEAASSNVQQNLMLLWEANATRGATLAEPSNSQWVLFVDSGAGPTYTVVPAPVTEFTTAAIGVGAYIWRTRTQSTEAWNGASLTFAYREDSLGYVLTGGHITSAKIKIEAGKMAIMSLTVEGTSWAEGTPEEIGSGVNEGLWEVHSSIPSEGTSPAVTPIKGILCPIWFAGTRYATTSIDIDLGIKAQRRESSEGIAAMSTFDNISFEPTVIVHPLHAEANANLRRNVTPGRLLVQIGSGYQTGTDPYTYNGMVFHLGSAICTDAPVEDENGRLRNAITFRACDTGDWASNVPMRMMQIGRA